jgi:hypothetical protein
MKKKRHFYLFFVAGLLFLSSISLKKETSCSKFKKGKFIYNFKRGSKSVQILIQRSDSIQTETNLSANDYAKLKVKWVSECVYELKFIESNIILPDSINKLQKSIVLRNEILSSTNDYYVFKSYALNADFIMTDTAWVKK